MPTDGCEIIVDQRTLEIRVIRRMDRSILDAIVLTVSAIRPPPNYAHFVHIFKISVRDAYRLEKGIVVLVDEGRLAGELCELGIELVRDFATESPEVGVSIATQFLYHLVQVKLHQTADMALLRIGLFRATHVNPNDPEPLRKLLGGYIAASDFPRHRWLGSTFGL